jgi:hypothetical protein
MLFVIFLIYISAKRKSQKQAESRTGGPGYPPPTRPQYAYPAHRHPYPPPIAPVHHPQPPPPKKDVKCDLCGSKNLRFFEKGYVKCNDCRHVFYITEGYRQRR